MSELLWSDIQAAAARMSARERIAEALREDRGPVDIQRLLDLAQGAIGILKGAFPEAEIIGPHLVDYDRAAAFGAKMPMPCLCRQCRFDYLYGPDGLWTSVCVGETDYLTLLGDLHPSVVEHALVPRIRSALREHAEACGKGPDVPMSQSHKSLDIHENM